MIIVQIIGDGIAKLEEATRILGSEGRARTAFARAINHTGKVVSTEAGRALSAQSGLPKRTGPKAYRLKVTRASGANLSYTVHGRGGDVSLKYFKPRETRKGVSAAPWNARRVYASSFMKAGWWPRRVVKPNWNGQVFIRTGTKFAKQDSGLFVPTEMVQGAAAAAWERGAPRLQPRIEHEVTRMTKGVVS
jgi:hypothetical protein